MTKSLKLAAMTATLLAGVSMALAAHAAIEKPVKTDAGLVSGTPGKVKGVTAFEGIPFGAPPVGDLRWKAPQPVAPWTGVRAGDKFGNVCMQPVGKGRLNLATDLPDSPKMSEDCLYLNVWTPAAHAGQKLPVMVWLYGGAYSEGAGSMPFSDGDYLARKGVILVSFNYRVGALGFLAHPALTAESPHNASGNYALMDAISALQWVKANIAAFGGDPDNVTIFGQSAGACMNAALVGSPEAKGLFRRAISESGAWMGLGIAKMTSLQEAEAQAVKTTDGLGLKTAADLRAMSAQDALTKLGRSGMIADGWIVPEDLSKTFAEGRQNKVDVLVGSNGAEGNFFGPAGAGMTADKWRDGAGKRWGSLADKGMAAYPGATDEAAQAAAPKPFTDALAWQMRLYATDQAKIGNAAWVYHFTNSPPYPGGKPSLGATHASEIAYVFDNLAAPREIPDGSSPELASADPRQVAFADQVSSYWVNFARTGNPNGAGLPKWPGVKALAPTETMLLDSTGSGAGPWLTKPQIDLYKATYDRDVGIH